jgi:hypothetical protein
MSLSHEDKLPRVARGDMPSQTYQASPRMGCFFQVTF